MRQQRLGHGGIAGRKTLKRDIAANGRRRQRTTLGDGVEGQMEDCGGQRAHQYADLPYPTVAALMYFAQARAEQPN